MAANNPINEPLDSVADRHRSVSTACERGDLSELKCALEEFEWDIGSEPLDTTGQTALHVACANGHLDVVKYLIYEKECDITVTNSNGDIPLMQAWANKRWKTVEFMLQVIQKDGLYCKLNLALKTVSRLQEVVKFGGKALYQACVKGYTEAVKFLASSTVIGVNSDVFQNCFQIACTKKYVDIVSYLLKEKSCDPTTVAPSSGTALLKLVWESKHWEVAELLLKAIEEKQSHKVVGLSQIAVSQLLAVVPFGEVALFTSCHHGFLEAVIYLDEVESTGTKASNNESIRKYFTTCFHVARSTGHSDIVEYLQNKYDMCRDIKYDERKADNIKNVCLLFTIQEKGYTKPVYLSPGIISELLEVQLFQNNTLHVVCKEGFNEAVKYLLDLSLLCESMSSIKSEQIADIISEPAYQSIKRNSEHVLERDSNGKTPLQLAWENKHWDSVNCLLNTIQKQQATCSHQKINDQLCPSLIAQLIEVAPFRDNALHVACGRGFLQAVQYINEEFKCSLSLPSSDGRSPLAIACLNGQLHVVRFLMTHDTLIEPGLTELSIACIRGDDEKAANLVSNEALDLGMIDCYGMTALHYASCQPFTLFVITMARQESIAASLVKPDRRGNTPLHHAAYIGCAKSVKLLCSYYESVDIKNSHGETPLHIAITSMYSNCELIKELVSHKMCRASELNKKNDTALQIAAELNKLDSAELLLTSGKCSNHDIVRAVETKYVLHKAIASERKCMVEALLDVSRCPISVVNPDGDTPLHIACNSTLEIFKRIVFDERCDLNTPNTDGNTALHITLSYQTLQKSHILIRSSRCNPNIADCHGNPPLHIAQGKNLLRTVYFILRNPQCDPNVCDMEGNTVLHLAVVQSSLISIEYLLDHKDIDVNVQNKGGKTPLHEAVINRVKDDIILKLIQHKDCNPNLVNNENMTPLEISLQQNLYRHADLLITDGKCNPEDVAYVISKFKCLLHHAVRLNRIVLVETILRNSECKINEVNHEGETPLHIAACMNCYEELERLISDGRCDLNAQNKSGDTALHNVAAQTNGFKMAKRIIESGKCNPNIVNNKGYAPLHIAVLEDADNETAKSLLTSVDCDPNIKDHDGNAPLHICISNISVSRLEVFLRHRNTDCNVQNKAGNTILHEAVMKEASALVLKSLLLHKSCDPSIQNEAGITALQYVCSSMELPSVSSCTTDPGILCDYVHAIIVSGKHTYEDILRSTEKSLIFHQAIRYDRLNLCLDLLKLPGYDVNITNEHGNTPLHLACKSKCSITILEKLVEDCRCDLNCKNTDDDTALHIATVSDLKSAEKVVCLLKSGKCNPNVTNRKGQAPLHIAIRKMKYDIADILLKYSLCDPNIQDTDGNTPFALHIIHHCKTTQSDILPILLQHKDIDLKIQNANGNTPLHEAAMRVTSVTVDIMKHLIHHDSCDLSIENNAGMTPLKAICMHAKIVSRGMPPLETHRFDAALAIITSQKYPKKDIVNSTASTLILHQIISSNQLHAFQTLLGISEYDINIANENGETPLHIACRAVSEIAMLERLVSDSRCNFNCQDASGNTALHVAVYSDAESKSTEMVQRLLQNERCDPNMVNSEGHTALHVAVQISAFEIATCILKHPECNPNIRDRNGNTPLHTAIEKGFMYHLPVRLDLFLNHVNIDISIQNNEGNTPLHEAVIGLGSIEVVRSLINHKSCDVTIENNAGMTPLQVTFSQNNSKSWEAPISQFQTTMFNCTAAMITSEKCLQQDILKSTASTLFLHQVIYSNQLNVLEILLKISEYDINVANENGETPLHIACRAVTKIAMLGRLVSDSRCNINCQDASGNTALHVAVYSDAESTERVQRLLQNERCDPNMVNSEGHTALHVTVQMSAFEIAACILKHPECNPNIQDRNGNTPLHMVIKEGMTMMQLEPFLKHDHINVNIQNGEGNTPLHKGVVIKALVDVVKALTLHSTCNPSIENNKGMSPLHISGSDGSLELTECLILSEKCDNQDVAKSINSTFLMHQAVSSNRLTLLKRLLNIEKCNTNSFGDSPLHTACSSGRLEYVSVLVNSLRCDVSIQNSNGDTALHVALCCKTDHNVLEIVKCVLQSDKCDPNITNKKGCTPLHVAMRKKNFEIAEILLRHPRCNPNIQDLDGDTPLHISMSALSLSTAHLFFKKEKIDLNTQNKVGNTPLHEAMREGAVFEVIKALAYHKTRDSNMRNNAGLTPNQLSYKGENPVHYACLRGNAEATQFWTELGCNVKALNDEGDAPIHIASMFMETECLRVLLESENCDPNQPNARGDAALHILCRMEDAEAHSCLKLILNHPRCDINQENAVGNTPLHTLCSMGLNSDMYMAHTLLLTTGIDPTYRNHAGHVPAELARSNYFIIEYISNVLEAEKKKVEDYLKVIVLGNPGVGKSTLIEAVKTEASPALKHALSPKTKLVRSGEYPQHTAGIVPTSFHSKYFGYAVFYEFAGQTEYYSSHAAVMENLILTTPPLFLLLIDISKPMNEVKNNLMYWWQFINTHSQQIIIHPNVFLVGTHKDTIKQKRENLHGKLEKLLESIVHIEVNFNYRGCFLLDCRQVVSKELTSLLSALNATCSTLRTTGHTSLHCHILKAFLNSTSFQDLTFCTLSTVIEKIKSEGALLSPEPYQLIPLLSTLRDKGHLMLFQNHTDVDNSWVILKPEVLLSKVNGSIFAPSNFKEYCREFAKSTGVVSLSNIKERFCEYNHKVIVELLIHLQFCYRIKDEQILKAIGKDQKFPFSKEVSEYKEQYYFFPGLVQTENPTDVCKPMDTITFQCGWIYKCDEEEEQLTTRFLHVLILRLAFSCEPPDDPAESESVILLKSCSVWKHGIAWWTDDGIETIVEVGLQCHWVAVMMRCPDTHKVQCAELRSKVIRIVLKAKQDFCPVITMNEYLIAPSSLRYPFEGRELTLYSMRKIASIVIEGKDFAKDIEGKKPLSVHLLLPFEPYRKMKDLIDHFFNTDQSMNTEISSKYLQQIAKKCYENLNNFKTALLTDPIEYEEECSRTGDSQVKRCVAMFRVLQRRGCKTWRDFEQEFSRFSIFCGRDPMEIAGRRSGSTNPLNSQDPRSYPLTSVSDQALGDSERAPQEHKPETSAGSNRGAVKVSVVESEGESQSEELTALSKPAESQDTNTDDDKAQTRADAVESPVEDSQHKKQVTLSSLKTADTLLRGEQPSLKDLTNAVVPETSSEWHALGLQLNINKARLDAIQTDYPRDCRRCCTEMLSEWLSQDDGASWPTLIAALGSRAVDKTELAGCLEECHMSASS